MLVTVECKKCDAIYHKKIDKNKKVVRVQCPFCKRTEKIKIKQDED